MLSNSFLSMKYDPYHSSAPSPISSSLGSTSYHVLPAHRNVSTFPCHLTCASAANQAAAVRFLTHCTTVGTPVSAFFFFFLFRAAPTACGGSQARGQSRATAAGLHHSHSNSGSELPLRHTPQLILNPLSEARDRTRILRDTNQIYFYCATKGTPNFVSFDFIYPTSIMVLVLCSINVY